MCGIAGFLEWHHTRSEVEVTSILQEMTSCLRHRGPDDEGFWSDETAGIHLGFRRLAIIDLTSRGHQPMQSESGRYIIVFNGEIYNYREIRQELLAINASGAILNPSCSDTAVILAAIEQWGVTCALTRMVGMFAFALWDTTEKILTLARDRIGEKPLYFAQTDDGFVFASELKSIVKHPGVDRRLDLGAVNVYLRRAFIPAPLTIFQGVSKLLPGTLLTISCKKTHHTFVPTPYWSAADVARNGLAHPFTGTDEDAVNELERLLSAAVRRQMIADVPLGAFLSGGIDSSSVVAIMHASSSQRIRTFSIGMNHGDMNEAVHAKAVAQHLGTSHTEWYVTDQDARDVVPLITRMYDEPFADYSQIPTHIVSRLARQHVTVCLTGDGGDELFGGYNSYLGTLRLWNILNQVPSPLRSSGIRALRLIPDHGWDRILAAARYVVPSLRKTGLSGVRIARTLDTLNDCVSPLSIYQGLSLRDSFIAPEARKGEDWLQHTMPDDIGLQMPALEQLLFYDLVGELGDNMLTKVDRASMAASLETRTPLLDPAVVEFSWQLPSHLKYRNRQGKWVLRRLLERHVPGELFDRPKQGFGIPLGDWLRGPLREWGEDLIDPVQLGQQGLLDPEAIRKEWDRLQSSRQNYFPGMWSVLMLQAWLANAADG